MTSSPPPAGGAKVWPEGDQNRSRRGTPSIPGFSLALIGLLVIVALGARRPSGGPAGIEPARLDLSLAETITALIVIAAVLDIAIIAWALWKRGHTVRLRPRRKGWMVRLIAFVAGFGLLMLLVSVLPELNQANDAGGDSVVASETASEEGWSWKWLVLVAGLGLAGTAAWAVTRRSDVDQGRVVFVPPSGSGKTEPIEDEWSYVIPSGDDPRSQVIRAYATLEEELRLAGHYRISSEAPTEFSARIGRSLPSIATPVAQLTDLFLIARFSRHTVRAAMASEAGRLLGQVVPHLGVTTP